MVRRISKSEIAGVLEQWRVGSLIKFVTQRVYAEQLIQGIPYLQAIDEFRSKEAGDGRSDAYEGLLTSFMSVGSSRAIYCMTALEDSNYQFFLQSKDGRRIRDEFSNRGAAVLIKDPVEFLLRFQEAEPEGINFGLVSYDGDIFEPKVALSNFKQAASEVTFHKNHAYEYQHEFRIVTGHDCDIDFKQEDRDGVTHNVFNGYIPYQGLRLGSLDDIAELLTFQ